MGENTLNRYEKYSFIKLLDNSRKATPFAMNVGIKNSRGDLYVMINSHAVIDSEFIKNGVDCIFRTGANAVGGKLNTINEEKNIIANAIPLAADAIFGAGGKRYRSRIDEGYVFDTLPYCLYKREVIDKIGLIDEELIRDQDEEYNYRLLKKGGKIYFTSRIQSFLHLRPSL